MKKLVSMFLVLAMCMSLTPAFAIDADDYPQRFWDVPRDYWAFEYIAELVDRGVLNGYEDGSFKPDDTVLRCEWAKMMVLVAGLTTGDEAVYFSDMSGHWANAYVNAAKDYLSAYADNTYKPDQAAVREDVTVSMVKLKGYDVSEADYSYLSQFSDMSSISNSLRPYIAVAVEKGLIEGFEDGTFRGQDTLTRAEAATLLWRASQYGSDNKVADANTQPLSTAQPTASADPVATLRPTLSPTLRPSGGSSGTTASAATPSPTTAPVEIATPKPYIVDTLKSVETDSFAYDGGSIYYVDGSRIYSMDPQTGDARVALDASDLTLTKDTVDMAEEYVSEEDSDISESGENEQETIVSEEYSNYVPTQVVYDQYNDRVVMNGYYQRHEKPFAAPDDDCEYYVAYDIGTGEVFWEFGNKYYHEDPLSIKCFISRDKVIVSNYVHSYEQIFNIETKELISSIRRKYSNGNDMYWNVGNELYVYGYSDELYKYDFSASEFVSIFDFQTSSYIDIGINGDDVYYWNINHTVHKINLTTGQVSELDISADSEKCEVLDMTTVALTYYNSSNLIPISDDYIIFYDKSAKAFRVLSAIHS